MSFWDNVKKFAQPYADDDYDDYNEDDEYLDDYDEPAEPARRAPARRRSAASAPVQEEDAAEVGAFLSGCVYAVDGSVKKIAQSAYLFCPANMDVVGDLESMQAEVESYI